MSKSKRSFIQLSRAWYGESCMAVGREDETVTIGLYYDEGGCDGEFEVVWCDLEDNGKKLTPELKVFDEAWGILFNDFHDLLKEMSTLEDENISSDDFCRMLVSLGIEDVTPIEKP